MDADVVDALAAQHAEEAAFLWEQRDGAARSWRYDLAGLAALDERLDAHLAALRACPTLRPAARAQLSSADRGERFVLAWLSLLDDPTSLEALAEEADDPDDPDALDPVVAALAWHPSSAVAPWLPWLLDASRPARVRRVGVAAAAAHRVDPGAALETLCTSDEPALRGRAFRAAGELARVDLVEVLTRRAWDDGDLQARGAAAWSATLLGRTSALDALWEAAKSARDGGLRHATLAARCAPREVALARLLGGDLPDGAVIEASMMLGDAAMVPWLLTRMRDDALARRAGRAFEEVTGCPLVAHGLAEEAAARDLGDEDDPADADPDEDLPTPDADAVARWWAAHALAPGVRRHQGGPWDDAVTTCQLRQGDQSRRARMALDHAVRHAGPLPEVRAPAWRQ